MTAADNKPKSDIDDFFSVTQAITAGMQTATAQPISMIAIRPTPVLVRKVANHRTIDRKSADSGGVGGGTNRTQPCRDGSGKGSHQYRQNDPAAPNGLSGWR